MYHEQVLFWSTLLEFWMLPIYEYLFWGGDSWLQFHWIACLSPLALSYLLFSYYMDCQVCISECIPSFLTVFIMLIDIFFVYNYMYYCLNFTFGFQHLFFCLVSLLLVYSVVLLGWTGSLISRISVWFFSQYLNFFYSFFNVFNFFPRYKFFHLF